MGLTERPSDWKIVVRLSEPRDTQSKFSQVWTLDLKEPILLNNREFGFTKPLKLTTITQRHPESVEVLIQIETEVATECRRCCAPLTVEIRDEFMYAYTLKSDESANLQNENEEEFADSEKITVPVAHLGNSLNISQQVWESLVVSLPVYASCPNGCDMNDSVLHSDEEVDPRLQVLADLLLKEKQKGGN